LYSAYKWTYRRYTNNFIYLSIYLSIHLIARIESADSVYAECRALRRVACGIRCERTLTLTLTLTLNRMCFPVWWHKLFNHSLSQPEVDYSNVKF